MGTLVLHRCIGDVLLLHLEVSHQLLWHCFADKGGYFYADFVRWVCFTYLEVYLFVLVIIMARLNFLGIFQSKDIRARKYLYMYALITHI